MLHIATALFRYENLPIIHASLPDVDDITWHIAKISSRDGIDQGIVESDRRIRIYEVDCDDKDLISKRNAAFSGIKDGHFHLLDDDTVFHPAMYDAYLKHRDFVGMVIGKQALKNGKTRLHESLPCLGYIDAGNVLCHSSILDRVKWEERKGLEWYRCRDFIFWDNCFRIFGIGGTILVSDVISTYNALK